MTWLATLVVAVSLSSAQGFLPTPASCSGRPLGGGGARGARRGAAGVVAGGGGGGGGLQATSICEGCFRKSNTALGMGPDDKDSFSSASRSGPRRRRPPYSRGNGDDDMYGDDDYDEDEYGDYRGRRGSVIEPLPQRKGGIMDLMPSAISKAVLAGMFVLGIGTGVTLDSAINTNPKDLASRDAIDRQAPNPNICQIYGSSAMALDQRVFVTFNPFSIHVSQADVKPACVLRPANVVEVLQRRHLLSDKEVNTCKNGMNTWAFVGDLDDNPLLSCVYQSDDAQNEFLSNPKIGLGEDVYDDDRAKIINTLRPK